MLALRSALTWLLPELPSWLAAEIARAEHCRREMQCKGTSPRPTPPTPPSTTSPSQLDHDQITPMEIGTTNDQSLESHFAEDIIYQSRDQLLQQHLQQQLQQSGGMYYPNFDAEARFGLDRNFECDINMFENRDTSPDSPPSQVNSK